jgi:protein AroM
MLWENFTPQIYWFKKQIVYTYSSVNLVKLVELMSKKRIGALTIGQSPRPDLVAPLEHLMQDCEIVQAGALDDLTLDDLPDPSNAAYPLATQMRDGHTVMVDTNFIASKLQGALNRLETSGVVATLLLCAGTFDDLRGKQPLFVPFKICCEVLHALQMTSIGLITPIMEQEAPLRARWQKNKMQPTVWTANLGEQDQTFHRRITQRIQKNRLDCIVLDYVGQPQEQVEQLQKSVVIPVIDVGQLAMVALASTL